MKSALIILLMLSSTWPTLKAQEVITARRRAAAATWAVSGTAAVQNVCTTTCALTISSPASNGFIWVGGMYRDDTCAFTGITDNGSGGSNTYNLGVNVDLDGHRSLVAEMAKIVHTGVTTVTVTLSIACQGGFIAQAFTNPTAAGTLDGTVPAVATATSAVQTSNSITTTGTSDLFTTQCFNNTSTAAFTATSPNTLIANETIPTDGSNTAAEYQLNLAAGAHSGAFTTAGSIQWFCVPTAWK